MAATPTPVPGGPLPTATSTVLRTPTATPSSPTRTPTPVPDSATAQPTPVGTPPPASPPTQVPTVSPPPTLTPTASLTPTPSSTPTPTPTPSPSATPTPGPGYSLGSGFGAPYSGNSSVWFDDNFVLGSNCGDAPAVQGGTQRWPMLFTSSNRQLTTKGFFFSGGNVTFVMVMGGGNFQPQTCGSAPFTVTLEAVVPLGPPIHLRTFSSPGVAGGVSPGWQKYSVNVANAGVAISPGTWIGLRWKANPVNPPPAQSGDFALDYVELPERSCPCGYDTCEMQLTDDSDSNVFFGFGKGRYGATPRLVSCGYQLTTSLDQLYMRVSELSLTRSEWLAVYDGPSSASRLLYNMTQTNLFQMPRAIAASGPSMFIRFSSNSLLGQNTKGFLAFFYGGKPCPCGPAPCVTFLNATANEPQVISLNSSLWDSKPFALRCFWHISLPDGYQAKFSISQASLGQATSSTTEELGLSEGVLYDFADSFDLFQSDIYSALNTSGYLPSITWEGDATPGSLFIGKNGSIFMYVATNSFMYNASREYGLNMTVEPVVPEIFSINTTKLTGDMSVKLSGSYLPSATAECDFTSESGDITAGIIVKQTIDTVWCRASLILSGTQSVTIGWDSDDDLKETKQVMYYLTTLSRIDSNYAYNMTIKISAQNAFIPDDPTGLVCNLTSTQNAQDVTLLAAQVTVGAGSTFECLVTNETILGTFYLSGSFDGGLTTVPLSSYSTSMTTISVRAPAFTGVTPSQLTKGARVELEGNDFWSPQVASNLVAQFIIAGVTSHTTACTYDVCTTFVICTVPHLGTFSSPQSVQIHLSFDGLESYLSNRTLSVSYHDPVITNVTSVVNPGSSISVIGTSLFSSNNLLCQYSDEYGNVTSQAGTFTASDQSLRCPAPTVSDRFTYGPVHLNVSFDGGVTFPTRSNGNSSVFSFEPQAIAPVVSCGDGICSNFTGLANPETCETCPMDCDKCEVKCQSSTGGCCAAGTFGAQGTTPCSPCAKGYYQPNTGRTSCIAAEIGTYTDATGSAAPTSCGDGGTTLVTGSQSTLYCVPLAGYWRDPEDPGMFFACSPPDSCLGGVEDNIDRNGAISPSSYRGCAEGYSGRLCGDCAVGYYRLGVICEVCPSNQGIVVVIFTIVVVACIGVMKKLAQLKESLGHVTIGINGVQVCTLFASFPVPWPSQLTDFFNALSVVNFNMQVTNPECTSPLMRDYFSKWLIWVSIPMIGLAVLVLALIWSMIRNKFARAYGRKLKNWRPDLFGLPEDQVQRIKQEAEFAERAKKLKKRQDGQAISTNTRLAAGMATGVALTVDESLNKTYSHLESSASDSRYAPAPDSGAEYEGVRQRIAIKTTQMGSGHVIGNPFEGADLDTALGLDRNLIAQVSQTSAGLSADGADGDGGGGDEGEGEEADIEGATGEDEDDGGDGDEEGSTGGRFRFVSYVMKALPKFVDVILTLEDKWKEKKLKSMGLVARHPKRPLLDEMTIADLHRRHKKSLESKQRQQQQQQDQEHSQPLQIQMTPLGSAQPSPQTIFVAPPPVLVVPSSSVPVRQAQEMVPMVSMAQAPQTFVVQSSFVAQQTAGDAQSARGSDAPLLDSPPQPSGNKTASKLSKAIHAKLQKFCQYMANEKSRSQMKIETSGLIGMFLMFLTLSYTFSSSNALEPLDCTRQKDGSYTLDARASVKCWTGTHAQYAPLAFFFTALYVFGIPLTLFCLLRYYHTKKLKILDHRKKLIHRNPKQDSSGFAENAEFDLRQVTVEDDLLFERADVSVGFMTARYEMDNYMWDLCVMMRKLAIIVVQKFFSSSPLFSVSAGLGVIFVAFILQLTQAPYLSQEEDRLEALMILINFVTLFSGLMFLSDKFPSTESADTTTWIVIGAQGAVLAFVVLLTFFAILKKSRAQRKMAQGNWKKRLFIRAQRVYEPEVWWKVSLFLKYASMNEVAFFEQVLLFLESHNNLDYGERETGKIFNEKGIMGVYQSVILGDSEQLMMIKRVHNKIFGTVPKVTDPDYDVLIDRFSELARKSEEKNTQTVLDKAKAKIKGAMLLEYFEDGLELWMEMLYCRAQRVCSPDFWPRIMHHLLTSSHHQLQEFEACLDWLEEKDRKARECFRLFYLSGKSCAEEGGPVDPQIENFPEMVLNKRGVRAVFCAAMDGRLQNMDLAKVFATAVASEPAELDLFLDDEATTPQNEPKPQMPPPIQPMTIFVQSTTPPPPPPPPQSPQRPAGESRVSTAEMRHRMKMAREEENDHALLPNTSSSSSDHHHDSTLFLGGRSKPNH